jgi:hypothetical protein
MSRINTVILGLAGALLIGMAGAACASAAETYWLVGGVELAAGQTHTVSAKWGTGQAWQLTSNGQTIKITCSRAEAEDKLIGGRPGTDLYDNMSYKECTANTGTTGCILEGGVNGEGWGAGKWITRLAASGETRTNITELVTVNFTLGGCTTSANNRSYTITGKLSEALTNGAVYVHTAYQESEEVLSSVGSEKITDTGEGEIKLEGSSVQVAVTGLPVISVTLGSAYPLHIQHSSATIKTKVSDPVENLKGEGLTLSFATTASGSSGTFEATFKEMENSKGSKCETAGAGAGTVVMKGTFAIVSTSVTEPLLGILYSPETVELTCAPVKAKVKGTMLASLKPEGSEAEELASFSEELTGNGAGVPTLKTYYNEAGEAKVAQLLTNFGTNYKESAEELGAEITTTATESKMFTITSR